MFKASSITIAHADAAIPDAAVLHELGIDCELEAARLSLAVASRYLAYGDSMTRRNPYQGMTLVMSAMACEVATDDGVLPPSLPRLNPTGLSQGSTALQRSGVEALDIVRAWELRPRLLMACFPPELMAEFIAPHAWPYLAAFIAAGPAEATKRLYEAIKLEAQRLTARTVRTHTTSAWQLMKLLNEFEAEYRGENERRVRAGDPPLATPGGLDSWTWRPPKVIERTLINMGARTDKRNTSAPPLAVVRRSLSQVAAEAKWGRYSPDAWPANTRWRALKRFVCAALLNSVSPRVTHLRMLNVDDFAWHRFEDGTEGWGLRMRGEVMKMRSADEIYWIKLPDSLADIIHAWILCSNRQIGQPNAPLLVARKVTEAGDPGKRYASINVLEGFVKGKNGEAGRTSALVPEEQNPHSGYQPHRFRSFVVQNIDAVIHVWRLENPTHPLASIEPKVFAELLVDHIDDDMGYRDFSFDLRREQIVALAAALHWNSIWGEGARRRGLDTDAVRRTREHRDLLAAQIKSIDHEIAELERKKARLRRKHGDLLQQSRSLSGDDLEHARFELDAGRDQIDELNDEINQRFRRQLRAKDDLLNAEAAFQGATTTQVALPDELTEPEYERLLADAFGDPLDAVNEQEAPKSDELTPADLADLFGVHSQTIWRWRTEKTPMPNPRPFDPTAWIRYTDKDYRLPIEAINLAAIPAANPEQALATIRRRRAQEGFNNRTPTIDPPPNTPAPTISPPFSENHYQTPPLIEPVIDAPPFADECPRDCPTGITAELRHIMRSAGDRNWTIGDLLEWLPPQHRDADLNWTRASIGGALHRLEKGGELERVARGQYRVFRGKAAG